MDSSRVCHVLMQIAEPSTGREHEQYLYSSNREAIFNEEAKAESPIFDSFHNSSGSEAIAKITDITPTEFRNLYDILRVTIVAY